ncbi:MAG: hypothetical protein U0T78_09520 [Cloacibacterium normanense]
METICYTNLLAKVIMDVLMKQFTSRCYQHGFSGECKTSKQILEHPIF